MHLSFQVGIVKNSILSKESRTFRPIIFIQQNGTIQNINISKSGYFACFFSLNGCDDDLEVDNDIDNNFGNPLENG